VNAFVSSPAPGRTRCNDSLGTFAERFPVLFEPAGRLQKAAKIIAVLRRHPGVAVEEATLLEVGSSTCIMAAALARVCRRVVAFDTDQVALRAGVEYVASDHDLAQKMEFLVGDGTRMPVADSAVDIVICNQVYEHVDDQPGLLAEIHRVLKPGGICYFGIGTRHVVIEGHYKLPFLSWLPPRAADVYVKLRGRDLRYDVALLSYRRLKKLVREFTIFDYTVDIIRRPADYAAVDVLRGFGWLSHLSCTLLRWLRPIIPVHVWVLHKPSAGRPGPTVVVQS
jgi:SAM-dependent methyltransferase